MSATVYPAPTRGILAWFASTDHKSIAIRMAATSTFFLAAAGVLILLVRTELVSPGMQVIGEDTFNQFFTIHGSSMVYLVVTPLALGLGMYFVPLQVGGGRDLRSPPRAPRLLARHARRRDDVARVRHRSRRREGGLDGVLPALRRTEDARAPEWTCG